MLRQTDSLVRAVRKHLDLTPEEENFLRNAFQIQSVPRGEVIEASGEPTRGLMYVTSGCLMTYYTDKKGDDHVTYFATAGWWTGDLHSLTADEPSIYTTRTLVDSELLMLTNASLNQLLERYPRFERYFRIIFQNSLVSHQHRIIQNYSYTAQERYESFRERFPTLEQYVPLKYIASYLGMTPEFLSKIRRRMAKR
ncbi:MAG: Crp/Fnr family transcriptional regulator [Cyclobacteriaceae bacterium]|nr:Crp/Fnr family transcriptional regulator [Cyclobacteriaceae bacterium]